MAQLRAPDVVSWSAADSACEKRAQWEGPLGLLQEKQTPDWAGQPDDTLVVQPSALAKKVCSERQLDCLLANATNCNARIGAREKSMEW